MGNEASKDGSHFPTPKVSMDRSLLSNKRSRVSEEVEEAPAVEMTAISKSKSKLEEQPEKTKTQKQLNEEINSYKCTNSSCCREAGGGVFFGIFAPLIRIVF